MKKPKLEYGSIRKFGFELLPYISAGYYNHAVIESRITYHITASWLYWFVSIKLDRKLKEDKDGDI